MLYLVTKELYGFNTIFDALNSELFPENARVGRTRDIVIEYEFLSDIPAALALTWSEESPLGPLQIAALTGRVDEQSGIFQSILVDQNITSIADFVEYGYAFYEIAPDGVLIRLAADGTPYGDEEIPNPPDPFQDASFSETMTGPFSIVAERSLDLDSIEDIDGATIAVILGSPMETSLNAFFMDRGFNYEPVPVPDLDVALNFFQNGRSDLFVYPTRLISEEFLLPQFEVLSGTFGTTNSGATVTGTNQSDSNIEGTPYDDVLLGLSGHDFLIGRLGNDRIDGGSGTDTAIYTGGQSSYVLTVSPTGITLLDRREGGDGLDTLIDVELLSFAPESEENLFDLRVFAGTAALSSDELQSFIELYIAYFNRAPDALGLNFWGTAFANGTSLEEIAALFVDQDETRLTYPTGQSNEDFATTVYNNVLGRIPDQEGFAFWVELLDNGAVSQDTFILEVLRGAKSQPPPDASLEFITQQLIDRDYLETKTILGTQFAVTLGMSNVENAREVMATYTGEMATSRLAWSQISDFYDAAQDPLNGEFLMPLVGVIDGTPDFT